MKELPSDYSQLHSTAISKGELESQMLARGKTGFRPSSEDSVHGQLGRGVRGAGGRGPQAAPCPAAQGQAGRLGISALELRLGKASARLQGTNAEVNVRSTHHRPHPFRNNPS